MQIGRAGAGIGGRHSAQAAHGLPVVLVLIQRHVVIGGLDAGRDHQFRRRVPFEFGKRLHGLSDEMLVEVAERRIQLSQDVGRDLIAVGVGPVVPDARAEDAPLGLLAQNRRVAGMPVAVQLVDAARLGGGEVDGRSVLIELFVPVARGVSFGVELPPVAQIGSVGGVFEIGLHVIDVVAVVIGVGRAVRQAAACRPAGSYRRTAPPARASGWSCSECWSRCPPARRTSVSELRSENRY